MNFKKFEQHIAETLNAEELTLNIQDLIEDIHRNKKKRRMGIFWLWATIGLMIMGSGVIVVNMSMKKKTTSITSSTVHVTNTAITKPSETRLEKSANEFVINNDATINKIPSSGKKIKNGASGYKNSELAKHTSSKKRNQVSSINELSYVKWNENNLKIQETKLSGSERKENNQNLNIIHKTILPIQTYQNKLSLINRDKIVCPTFSNSGKMYLEIIPEIGAFLPLKKLENVGNEVDNVFNQRNSHENSLEGLNAGLYLKLSKEKSPFYLKAGLSWSRLSEKMALSYSYTRKDTTQGIISVTVSQTGDTITYIYGDIIQERKISGNKTKHYSISMLDLPLSVGAEKRFGSWLAGIEAGLSLNISVQSAGNILVSDTSFASLNTPIEYFKPSLGLSYFGGAHIGKEFNNAGRIFLAARVRLIPDSFSADQNRIRQTYQFIGLNMGYVYTF